MHGIILNSFFLSGVKTRLLSQDLQVVQPLERNHGKRIFHVIFQNWETRGPWSHFLHRVFSIPVISLFSPVLIRNKRLLWGFRSTAGEPQSISGNGRQKLNCHVYERQRVSISWILKIYSSTSAGNFKKHYSM